jgi:1,4-alpha-glucan branching enzyme
MRRLVPSGVWEIFIPDLPDGTCYKYEVRTATDQLVNKADPYAQRFEVPPNTASIIWTPVSYAWGDASGCRRRGRSAAGTTGRWPSTRCTSSRGGGIPENNRYLSYRELAETLVPYVRDMGYTHIELMPVMEHPFSGSWGYQVIGFFAPTSRFGTPDDFRYFVDVCHQHGIGVILDWVPGHFPKDQHGLARIRRHVALRARRSAQGRASRLGHADLQLRPQRGADVSAQQRALLARGVSHRRAARRCRGVDALSRLLASAGQWIPNQYGGRENLEAVSFLQQLNTIRHGPRRGHGDSGRGVDVMAGRQQADVCRRSRFHLQVEHGMDARHAGVHPSGPRASTLASQPDHVLDALCVYRELRAAVSRTTRSCTASGRCSTRCRAIFWQKHANLRALYGYMYAQPGKKLMSMGARSVQWREWNYNTSLDWHLLDYASIAACSSGFAI